MHNRTPQPLRRAASVRLALLAGLASAVVGCASDRPSVVNPIERWEALQQVSNGTLRLSCATACIATWRLARGSLKGLYANQVWDDLAASVATVGYESDLGYFYLARVAEAKGARQAAETYFRLSLASTSKCDGWIFNSCDGIDIPKEAAAGITRVGGK